jgi:hypothetical protein
MMYPTYYNISEPRDPYLCTVVYMGLLNSRDRQSEANFINSEKRAFFNSQQLGGVLHLFNSLQLYFPSKTDT